MKLYTHLYKEYITYNHGKLIALKYMVLFTTDNKGNYIKHIDLLRTGASYDLIPRMVDKSYFTFIYDLNSSVVMNLVNEPNLIIQCKMMINETKIIPKDAIRQLRIREFYENISILPR